MQGTMFFKGRKPLLLTRCLVTFLCAALAGPIFTAAPALAAPGDTFTTPVTPMELPIEVEIELSPAGSLKQALLWKELYQLLGNPYSIVCPPDDPSTPLTDESNYCTSTLERRPGFGVAMPAINVYSLGYNFLTAQPVRLRTSDGEVSWDQPGPLFATNESCLDSTLGCDQFNTPTELRSVIGALVACPLDPASPYTPVIETLPPGQNPCGPPDEQAPNGSLVVLNPGGNGNNPNTPRGRFGFAGNGQHPSIPPNQTVVAVAAFFDGVLHELEFDAEGVWTGEYEVITELEAPVNEEDFYRDPTADASDIVPALQPYVGRPAAEILGKALFWDMQIGSDGVQACASCHFHAGADNRSKNQLNPNHIGAGGNNLTLEVLSAINSPTTNVEVVATDFPFHRLANIDISGESTSCGPAPLPACADPAVLNDTNDVMSSMGVSRFTQFDDVLVGAGAFIPGTNPAVLMPDAGTPMLDPIPIMQDVRRIEPRNTPTFHGAAFNFDNFWDGRARFNFNFGSVFGPSDPTAHVFFDAGLGLVGGTMGNIRPELIEEDPEVAGQPIRIKFSSLASQSVGPPLSEFEMAFLGRNWAKIGKKLLQAGVTPLANQTVDPTDSVLGPFANVGGTGLTVTYTQLIQAAFRPELWQNTTQSLAGCFTDGRAPACAAGTPDDPFDHYVLTIENVAPDAVDTNRFTQMEANFSGLFGLAVQTYEELTIPDHTLADQFFDANPNAGHGVGEPGDQAVLFPTLIPDLLDDGLLNGTNSGVVTLIPDNPATPEYDAFGPDELFGFDMFAGANLTAGLPPDTVDPISGRNRNPVVTNTLGQTITVGSNPFTRSAKCMLCHLGPEQTDHSINISHGLLKNDAEFEYPTPPAVPDPTTPATFPPEVGGPFAGQSVLPAPEPSGSSRTVAGLILAEEVGEGAAQDAVEVEPRNLATLEDLATPWPDAIISQPKNFAFGDQGVYNLGLTPIVNDIGRGGDDPFGWPLSLSALTLKNIGGQAFEPCDLPTDECVMANFDANDIGAEEPGALQGFEETGDGAFFPGTAHTLQSINPGFERDPIFPQMPEYMIPWMHSLPAGELHPQIDEMAGMVPNTITAPNGGPAIEFPEILFGADFHCAAYNPAIFGLGPPNFGWGPPTLADSLDPVLPLCPQHQSGVAGNHAFPSQGTWPVPNRVLRDGAFKAPALRNVAETGPYFHSGGMLTLRQVVDFYMRGGDFPVTNAESRDPSIVEVDEHAFGFGPSQGTFAGFNLLDGFDCSTDPPNDPAIYPLVEGGCGDFDFLIGSFGDGLPDTAFLYDEYPDSDHPITPEPTFPGETPEEQREAALEDAKNAIVKFLIALSDPRTKREQAPFDHPELFVPIDGAAPQNDGGPAQLVSLSGVPCPVPGPGSSGICFRQIPAVGTAGNPTPVPAFLNVTSEPPIVGGVANPAFNCSVANGPVSHFCSVVTP